MKYLGIFILIGPLVILAQTTENITFQSQNLELEGTMYIPGLNEQNYPVVILVHGSGPNNRYQTTPLVASANTNCLYPNLVGDTIENFKDISEALVDSGFAVFTYDKRSFSHPDSIDPLTITINDFITDIHSAVDYVKTRNDINDSCIILAGHSQGALLIAKVANQRNDITHLISLAGAATPIDTLLAEQYNYIINECNNDSVAAQNQYNQVVSVFNQVRNGTWNPNTPILGTYPQFWKSWIELSDSAIYFYNNSNLPALFIQGNLDINVPLDNIQSFENEITSDSEFYTSNGANHFLTTQNRVTVKQDINDTIIAWLKTFKVEQDTTNPNPNSILNVLNERYYSISIKDKLLTLSVNDNITVYNVTFYNLQGKLLNIPTIKNEQSVFQFSLSGKAQQLIILKATTSQGVITKKIIL